MLKTKLSLLKKPSKKHQDQNNYQRLKLVGQGTFGKVYLTLNKVTNQHCALKQVPQDPKYKNRQLSIIALLDHPNIIQLQDYYLTIQQGMCILHLVMEYMDNSLQSLIKEQRLLKIPFAPLTRKIIAFQLFKGLAYLELNKIVHRDLKPPNILLNLNLQLKICDFGSAKIIETKQNNVSYICSRYYRAPQLILNSTTYGSQIDIWSAGCVIVELLTLEPLFPGDSSLQQLIEIIKILGTPSKKIRHMYNSEIASNLHLPKIKANDWKQVLKRYHPQDELIDLIKNILTYNIKQRLTAFQALQHSYFHDLPTYKQVAKLPFLLDFQCLRTQTNDDLINQLTKLYQHRVYKEKQNNLDHSETASTTPQQHYQEQI